MQSPRQWSTNAKRRLAFYGSLVAIVGGLAAYFTAMPGTARPRPRDATPMENERAARLGADLHHLSTVLGERNVGQRPAELQESARWLSAQLSEYGYEVAHQRWNEHGVPVENLWVERPGSTAPQEQIVIGAHYDSAEDAPGADDNGTGVVALLALARELRTASAPAFARSVRLVFFTNEEPPWFWSEAMGSLRYARAARERGDDVHAMVSLETMGYFSREEGSQRYPGPVRLLYPSRGDFLGFVGSTSSRSLVRRTIRTFRECGSLPSEGAALPGVLPGVGWSDHWAFERAGYPAVMVTDTAPFRYPHYHTPADTQDKVDTLRLSRAITCLHVVIADLAGGVVPAQVGGGR